MGELGDVHRACLVPPVNERAGSPLCGVWTLPQKRKPKADPASTRFTSARYYIHVFNRTNHCLFFTQLAIAIFLCAVSAGWVPTEGFVLTSGVCRWQRVG